MQVIVYCVQTRLRIDQTASRPLAENLHITYALLRQYRHDWLCVCNPFLQGQRRGRHVELRIP